MSTKQNILLSLQSLELLALGARASSGESAAQDVSRYGGMVNVLLAAKAPAHPETNMVSSQAVANLSRTSSSASSAIDLGAKEGRVRFTLVAGAATAGTSPTLNVKVTHCATSDGSFADVTDAAFDEITETAGVETLVLNVADLERYVKIEWAIAGSESPEFPFGVVMQSYPEAAGDATLDVKLQHADESDGSYSDVVGGAFTQVTTAGSEQGIKVNGDGLKKYVKAVYTIAGTDGLAYEFGVAFEGFYPS